MLADVRSFTLSEMPSCTYFLKILGRDFHAIVSDWKLEHVISNLVGGS